MSFLCSNQFLESEMDILKFFLFGLFISVVSANSECSASFCSNYTFPIRFPFYLMDQPQYCGYPGFNLSCTNEGKLFFSLPYSGDFLVQDIDYQTQEIRLYDPQGCLPGRLLKLNLSSSPFAASYYKIYTFLACPPQLVRPNFTVIDCLSNSTISILATSSPVLARSMNACSILATISIPILQYRDDFLSDGDLFLSWNIPNCKICEAKGGTCQMGFMGSNASQDILCSVVPVHGKGHPGFLRLIGFTIFLPFVVLPALFVGILYCRYILNREQNRAEANLRVSNTAAIISQLTNPTRGLDDSIIQSYPKIILDESRKIPGNIDPICPICIAEYHAGEALRCIPKCDHYFHADCIDEWLRIKRTCPVCRTAAPSDVVQNP